MRSPLTPVVLFLAACCSSAYGQDSLGTELSPSTPSDPAAFVRVAEDQINLMIATDPDLAPFLVELAIVDDPAAVQTKHHREALAEHLKATQKKMALARRKGAIVGGTLGAGAGAAFVEWQRRSTAGGLRALHETIAEFLKHGPKAKPLTKVVKGPFGLVFKLTRAKGAVLVRIFNGLRYVEIGTFAISSGLSKAPAIVASILAQVVRTSVGRLLGGAAVGGPVGALVGAAADLVIPTNEMIDEEAQLDYAPMNPYDRHGRFNQVYFDLRVRPSLRALKEVNDSRPDEDRCTATDAAFYKAHRGGATMAIEDEKDFLIAKGWPLEEAGNADVLEALGGELQWFYENCVPTSLEVSFEAVDRAIAARVAGK
jgi:hypothetical protein